jgi:hypothetical protein
MLKITTTAGDLTAWNGPVCSTCGARYLGAHSCSREDIARRIAELARLMDALPSATPVDRTAGCPCRPENGGSGVCGCIMGGATITCSVA